MRICRKYCLIPQEYNGKNKHVLYGGGYLWLCGGWFCDLCDGGVGV